MLQEYDAIYFPAQVGDPKLPDDVTLWGLRLKICQGFDQYANVRPTRILPGIMSPFTKCGGGRYRLGDRSRKIAKASTRDMADARIAGVSGRGRDGDGDFHPGGCDANHALRL